MKKSLFILMMVLVAMISCEKTTVIAEPKTDDPTKTDTTKVDTTKREINISYMLGQYVGPLTEEAGAAKYLQFLFYDGEVGYIQESGSAYGTGNVYRVAVFAESVDANMFPKNGRYTGNESFEANTFYCTSSSSANGYTAIMEFKDGGVEKITRILEGTIDISGNSETGEFVLELKDENGVSHSLYYKGAAPVEAAE